MGCYGERLAGKAAASAAKSPQDQRWKILMQYDQEWRDKFASDLKRMGIAHRIFAGLSDETLSRLFEAVRGYLPEIQENGDMDLQGKIISQMLRKRKFTCLLTRVAFDSGK